MVTEICLYTSYNLLLVCATSWELYHSYFMYIIGYLIIVMLVDLHSNKWIKILLFELVVTCIKTHIFSPSCSISHIFISVVKFFCCFLLVRKITT